MQSFKTRPISTGSVSDNSDIFSVSSGASSTICFANPLPSELPQNQRQKPRRSARLTQANLLHLQNQAQTSSPRQRNDENQSQNEQNRKPSSQSTSSSQSSASQSSTSEYLPSQSTYTYSPYDSYHDFSQSSIIAQPDDDCAMDYTQTLSGEDLDYMNIDDSQHCQHSLAEAEYVPESVLDSEATISIADAERLQALDEEIRDLYGIDGQEPLEQKHEEQEEQTEDTDLHLIKEEEDASSENEDHEKEEKDEMEKTTPFDNMTISETDSDDEESSSSQLSDVDPNTGLSIDYCQFTAVGGNGSRMTGSVGPGLSQGIAEAGSGEIAVAITAGRDASNCYSGGVPGGVVVSQRANLFLAASQLSDCPPAFTGRGRLVKGVYCVRFMRST